LEEEHANRRQEMKCERILHALWDVSKRLQLIEEIPRLLVSDHVQQQQLAQLLLLNEGGSATREALFRRYINNFQGNAYFMSPELQVAIFDICLTSGTTTSAVAFAKELPKRGTLFERLANRSMEHPNKILEIFNRLVLSTAQFSEFLDELSVFLGRLRSSSARPQKGFVTIPHFHLQAAFPRAPCDTRHMERFQAKRRRGTEG
jgi:hypothetical protein